MNSYTVHETGQARRFRPAPGAVWIMLLLLLALAVDAAAPVHADTSEVVCNGSLNLQRAARTGPATMSYGLGGTCSLRSVSGHWAGIRATPPVAASAHWNTGTRTFVETLHLLAPQSVDGRHVGTGAEVATYACDANPLVNRRAQCTVVKHDNMTGWGGQGGGFDWYPSRNQPILAGLATHAQVKAAMRHTPRIACRGLRPERGDAAHRYRYNGTCRLYHTGDGRQGLQLTHVLVRGTWDASGRQAKEGVNVLTAPAEGGGSWSTTYTCNMDPWLHRNAVCSPTARFGGPPPVFDPITDLMNQHPLAMGMGAGPGPKAPVHGKPAPGKARPATTTLHESIPANMRRSRPTVHLNPQPEPPSRKETCPHGQSGCPR